MTNNNSFYSGREGDFADAESDEDTLSPTDGYFSHREHPQDVYVDEPTTTIHAKELGAADESQASQPSASSTQGDNGASPVYTPRSSTAYTPASPAGSLPDENTPLIRHPSIYDAPPPAYTADEPSYDANGHTYQSITLPQQPVAETRTTPFFAGVEPESMGGPSEFDAERNMYRRPAKRDLARLCGSMCTTFWVFVAVAGIVWVWAAMSRRHADDQKHRPVQDTPSVPNWPSHCADGSSAEASYDFDSLPSFSFDERMETREFYGGIYGRVSLTAAPEGQSLSVRVNISATPSDPYSVKSMHVQKTRHGISLLAPELTRDTSARYDGQRKPCLLVSANIFVKPDITLDKLDVYATNLELALMESFQATVDKTSLQTIHTRISSESKTKSRETRIKSDTGSIGGHYNLLDLLDVFTQSGSINIDVNPKEASKEKNPAKLQCVSHSGSITVDLPHEDLPKRDYQTLIKTDVGSVSGTYIHGTKTELQARTGSINAAILPYSADDYESKLSTTTNTGYVHVELKSPYKGTTIKRMTSSHTTQSGSLHLNYPQEWEGRIKGDTTTGSLVLRGKDVVDEELDDGWVSKSVSAHKGDGELEGKLTFKTLTGSADVTIGDTAGGAWRRALESDLLKEVWHDAPGYREQ